MSKTIFGSAQARSTIAGEGPLATLEVTTDVHQAVVSVPRAAAFAEYSDLLVQAVLFEDKQTDFAGYSPLVIDVDMYRARNNNGQP